MPLDIAFFVRDGRLVDVQRMALYTGDACPVCRSPRPFRDALEAPVGTLDSLHPDSDPVVAGDLPGS